MVRLDDPSHDRLGLVPGGTLLSAMTAFPPRKSFRCACGARHPHDGFSRLRGLPLHCTCSYTFGSPRVPNESSFWRAAVAPSCSAIETRLKDRSAIASRGPLQVVANTYPLSRR